MSTRRCLPPAPTLQLSNSPIISSTDIAPSCSISFHFVAQSAQAPDSRYNPHMLKANSSSLFHSSTLPVSSPTPQSPLLASVSIQSFLRSLASCHRHPQVHIHVLCALISSFSSFTQPQYANWYVNVAMSKTFAMGLANVL